MLYSLDFEMGKVQKCFQQPQQKKKILHDNLMIIISDVTSLEHLLYSC